MSKKKRKGGTRARSTPARGETTTAGKDRSPSQIPDEEASPSEVKAVPIGRPITREHYAALKEKTSKRKPPSSQKPQVDPGEPDD